MVRGTIPLSMQCAPAFDYARAEHTTTIHDDPSSADPQRKATFVSKDCALDLRYVVDSTMVCNHSGSSNFVFTTA